MTYKTNEVAEKLNISVKSVLRHAKKLDIQKNELGHYSYSEADILAIQTSMVTPEVVYVTQNEATNDYYEILSHKLELLSEKVELQAQILIKKEEELLQYKTELENLKQQTPATINDNLFRKHITQLNARMARQEHQLAKKADDIVAYQVLQHRQEIEELNARITCLEEQKEMASEPTTLPENIIPLTSAVITKPKRKGLLLSIFGI